MKVTLSEFRENAATHGICEMSKDWDKCKSKKQLVDLALSIRGIEYLAKAIAEGWGIDPIIIAEQFEPFNYGRYTRDKDGYTSAMYCCGNMNPVTKIYVEQAALLIVDFIGEIYVPKNQICEVHAVNSKFYVYGDGVLSLKSYGNVEIYNEADTPAKIERI